MPANYQHAALLVQQAMIDGNTFSREALIQELIDLSPEDFNLFCKEIMKLREHYSFTCNITMTDRPDLVQAPEGVLFKPQAIDLEKPVNFRLED